jgi:hypothetical protein
MKTITSLLLGVLSIILSLLFLGLAVKSINLSANDYLIKGSEQTYTFFSTFITIAIIQAIIFIAFAVFACKCFGAFSIYYSNYQFNKRDRDIKKQTIESSYETLYNNLKGTNIEEERKKILREFYYPAKKAVNPTEKDIEILMRNIFTNK